MRSYIQFCALARQEGSLGIQARWCRHRPVCTGRREAPKAPPLARLWNRDRHPPCGPCRHPKQVSQRKVMMRALERYLSFGPFCMWPQGPCSRRSCYHLTERAPGSSLHVGTPRVTLTCPVTWKLLIFNSGLSELSDYVQEVVRSGWAHRGTCNDYSSSLQRKTSSKPRLGKLL